MQTTRQESIVRNVIKAPNTLILSIYMHAFEFEYFIKKVKNSQNLCRQSFDLNKEEMIDCIKKNGFSNVQ